MNVMHLRTDFSEMTTSWRNARKLA